MFKKIVQAGGYWYVRRWTIFGYEYMDRSGIYWWSYGEGRYCRFDSEQEARDAIPKVKKI